jgi:hypothetical protein
MELDITNAPTSPLTTRSSYVNNGKVINHTMQVTFTHFPEVRPFQENQCKDTHNVTVQQLDPKDVEAQMLKAINMLVENNAVEVYKPRYALVWQQIVGKENHLFENKPTILALKYH